MEKCQILLTNDDGIQSPGLWAAAEALSDIGYVTVAAPRDQSSGSGRSLPSTSDGIIRPEMLTVRGKQWTVYAVGGTPAQAVLHGILEIMKRKPDLVVSGINYGENVATGVTISGTVGAAMEAASQGVPALASSLETDQTMHFSYSTEIDFSTAAYFTGVSGGLVGVRSFCPQVAGETISSGHGPAQDRYPCQRDASDRLAGDAPCPPAVLCSRSFHTQIVGGAGAGSLQRGGHPGQGTRGQRCICPAGQTACLSDPAQPGLYRPGGLWRTGPVAANRLTPWRARVKFSVFNLLH